MDLTNKRRIKTLFSKVTLFISLYENFLRGYEDLVLAFYANHIRFENGLIVYGFVDHNVNPDKRAREEYEKAVHRTCRKSNGDWDRDLSLFSWLRKGRIITDEHFEQLKELRLLRNKLVHQLDSFLEAEFPQDLEDKINQLIGIRKHATKQWYLEIECPTSPEEASSFDAQAADLDQLTAIGNSDAFYDLIKEILEE